LIASFAHRARGRVEQCRIGLKSGKPCDRLIAPQSAASFDITVKMVVPTWGSFESMVTDDWRMAIRGGRGGKVRKRVV
jgi:hypothetical protein